VSAIVVFIAANVAEIILTIYNNLLFPRDYDNDTFSVVSFICILSKTVNVLTVYMIGDVTEKEVFILFELIVDLASYLKLFSINY